MFIHFNTKYERSLIQYLIYHNISAKLPISFQVSSNLISVILPFYLYLYDLHRTRLYDLSGPLLSHYIHPYFTGTHPLYPYPTVLQHTPTISPIPMCVLTIQDLNSFTIPLSPMYASTISLLHKSWISSNDNEVLVKSKVS